MEQQPKEIDWQELNDKYIRLLFYKVTRAGWSFEDAQDIIQDLWIRAWKSSHKWGDYEPWWCLQHQLKFVMIDKYRQKFGRNKREGKACPTRPKTQTNLDLTISRSTHMGPEDEAMFNELVELIRPLGNNKSKIRQKVHKYVKS